MLEQGELDITVNNNGSITVGRGHTISGGDVESLIKSASDAYGKRLGTVKYSDGSTKVLNEYKENPKKEVDPGILREVPKMHAEWKLNEDGTKAVDENGKNIVESWGVRYADGTISYTGSGREGVLEASRRRSQATLYNEAVTDARTIEDFNTEEQYNSFVTVKNIRIGQGSYVKLQDQQGNSKLVAPNGAVVASGSSQEVHKAFIGESNRLNLAMAAAERNQTFTGNEKRYIMEREGHTSDADFNNYVKSQLEASQSALNNIYSSWDTAAQEQGISTEGKMWYQPTVLDLTTYTPTITQSTLAYEGFLKAISGDGVTAEIESGVGTTETETTQVLEDDIEDTTTTTQPTDDLTATQSTDSTQPSTPPQSVTYTVPTGTGTVYTGTGTGTGTGYTGMQTPTMAPMTGTFTKPAGSGMMGYQPSQQYTLDSTTPQTPQISQQQQYEVRMYRNNAGMTTSITFVDGKPQTPIPSGFYPVDKQPTGQVPYQPQVSQVQTPTQQPVTGYTPQFNMNQGGIVPPVPTPSGNKFGGFKPEAMQRIAQNLGYSGDMGNFNQFLNDNPDKQQKMNGYMESARKMAEGGVVQKFALGGDVSGYTNVDYKEAGFTEPEANSNQFQALQTYYNPNTMQSTTVGSSGYGVPEGFVSYNQLASGSQSTAQEQQEQYTVAMQQYDPRALNQQYIPQQPDLTGLDLTQVQTQLAKTPGLPTGATVVPTGTQLTADQLVSPYSGQVSGGVALPTALAATEQAMLPTTGTAALMSPIEASGAVAATADQTQAAQLEQVAQINAAQGGGTSVSGLEAAQGTGILMDNPVQRQIQDGELISGVANAETASKFNEEIEAATATPTKQATVQGQLEGLMADFEGGNTPAWAAGSMRNAMATLSARGLGASSMAGQAVIQAAMEAALPIAQMDAQVQAQFEGQNLSNRQQRAMLAAQQRAQFLGQEFDQAFQSRVINATKISDVANMNFTAEQQVALENSRIANTMELTNLSNSQAMVLAEASALSGMDMSNLNNRQQAAVQNAQNFLQADLANLSNQQQTELFKAQQRVQSLFTDQAALNAAQQFNATSQNQTDQFFANLRNSTAQFNAAQANAQGQFNAGQVNTIERFNAEINNQRDQFNAQNRLVIDQSNAQWRRQIATSDTAAVNRANEINAQALLGYSQTAYNNLWQFYGDNMEWAWTSAENERSRISSLAEIQLRADAEFDARKYQSDAEASSGFGKLIGDVLGAKSDTIAGTILGSIF